MSDGFVEPALARNPMIVVGKSWIDVAFITINIIIEKFAFPLLSSNACIALMPIGVAALPRPSMFADMFRAIIFWVSSLSTLNIFFISGRNIFASFSPRPLASTNSKIPSQTAYTAQSSIHKERASVEAPIISDRTALGFAISKTKMLKNIIINQKMFITNYMRKNTKKE